MHKKCMENIGENMPVVCRIKYNFMVQVEGQQRNDFSEMNIGCLNIALLQTNPKWQNCFNGQISKQ